MLQFHVNKNKKRSVNGKKRSAENYFFTFIYFADKKNIYLFWEHAYVCDQMLVYTWDKVFYFAYQNKVDRIWKYFITEYKKREVLFWFWREQVKENKLGKKNENAIGTDSTVGKMHRLDGRSELFYFILFLNRVGLCGNQQYSKCVHEKKVLRSSILQTSDAIDFRIGPLDFF